MPTRFLASIIAGVLMIDTVCIAAWNHLDLESGDPMTYSIAQEYYDGLQERYAVSGHGYANHQDTFKGYNGVDATGTHTYIDFILTNDQAFATFDNAGVTHYPPITRDHLEHMDGELLDVDGTFVQHWLGGDTYPSGNADLEAYFANAVVNTNTSRTNGPQSLVNCNKAAIMEYAGIGYTSNLSTNVYGAITGGDAYFLGHPAVTHNWVVAWSAHSSAGDWNFKQGKRFGGTGPGTGIYYFEGTNFATVRGRMGHYTNDTWSSIAIEIEGVAFKNDILNTTYASSETVDVYSTNGVACTQNWGHITNIYITSTSEPTNIAIEVGYFGKFPLWGQQVDVLYAETMVERLKYLDALRWTQGGSPVVDNGDSKTASGTNGTCASARSVVSAAWPGSWTPDNNNYVVTSHASTNGSIQPHWTANANRRRAEYAINGETNIAQVTPVTDFYFNFTSGHAGTYNDFDSIAGVNPLTFATFITDVAFSEGTNTIKTGFLGNSGIPSSACGAGAHSSGHNGLNILWNSGISVFKWDSGPNPFSKIQ